MRAGFDLPRMAVEIAMGAEPALGARPVRPVRYVWATGETRGGLESLRQGDARGAARAFGDIAGALLLPRWMLDPGDPRAIVDTVRGGALRSRERRAAR